MNTEVIISKQNMILTLVITTFLYNGIDYIHEKNK